MMIPLPNFVKALLGGVLWFGLSGLVVLAAAQWSYRTTTLATHGVETKAVVKVNRGQDLVYGRGFDWRDNFYQVEFGGRAWNYESPESHEVGDELDVTWIPGTEIWMLTGDRPSLWKVLPICSVLILLGLGGCAFGCSILLRALLGPRPHGESA